MGCEPSKLLYNTTRMEFSEVNYTVNSEKKVPPFVEQKKKKKFLLHPQPGQAAFIKFSSSAPIEYESLESAGAQVPQERFE